MEEEKPKRRVVVGIDNFQGSISPGGEYVKSCKKGDVIEVEESTWLDMKRVYPNFFKLFSGYSEETDACFYGAERMNNIKKIGIIVTTFNRPEYLKVTLDSLTNTIFPENIHTKVSIIDDCSTDKETIKLIDNYIHERISKKFTNFIDQKVNKVNMGIWNTLRIGFDYLYYENYDVLINVDADMIMKPTWLTTLLDLHSKFPKTIVSGFNANSHMIHKTTDTYYLKNTLGGANLVFGWDHYLSLVRPAFEKELSWDWGMCDLVNGAEKMFVVSNPSVMNHIGIKSTLRHGEGGGGDYAKDWKE